AAADPREHQALVAERYALGARPDGDHLADRLVAQGHRQLEPARGHVELLAAAEIVFAAADVDVAVADAGGEHAAQHLGAARGRRRLLGALQRSAEFHDVVADHGDPPGMAFAPFWTDRAG